MKLKLLLFTCFLTVTSIALAQAETAAPAAGSAPNALMMNLPILLAVFGLFYFGIIRPNQTQQKKHAEFLTKIEKGEEVVTASGIIGRVVGVTDKVITLDISEGTEVKIIKSQIQGYLKDSVSKTV